MTNNIINYTPINPNYTKNFNNIKTIKYEIKFKIKK